MTRIDILLGSFFLIGFSIPAPSTWNSWETVGVNSLLLITGVCCLIKGMRPVKGE